MPVLGAARVVARQAPGPDRIAREHVQAEVRPRYIGVCNKEEFGYKAAVPSLNLEVVAHLHEIKDHVTCVVHGHDNQTYGQLAVEEGGEDGNAEVVVVDGIHMPSKTFRCATIRFPAVF